MVFLHTCTDILKNNVHIIFRKYLVNYLHIVSISIPENPKALSPWMDITLFPGAWSLHQIPAATANPNPTPMVPKLPASNLQAKQRAQAYLKLFVYVCNEYQHIICSYHKTLFLVSYMNKRVGDVHVLVSKCHFPMCSCTYLWRGR